MILILGKAWSHRTPNLGCKEGWVTWAIWCFAKKLCTRHDACAGTLLWWSCQSAVAHICGLLNHPNSFHAGMFKLNAKFDADLLLYLLHHFEWDSHTVHMLTQWRLSPPLTSTVKLSWFTQAHSSLLSLAARLYLSCTNHSHISNGWALSVQTSYTRTRINHKVHLKLICYMSIIPQQKLINLKNQKQCGGGAIQRTFLQVPSNY